jgi:hypothetical protein
MCQCNFTKQHSLFDYSYNQVVEDLGLLKSGTSESKLGYGSIETVSLNPLESSGKKVAGLLSNKLILRVTPAAILVVALAAILAWRAAKLAFSHVVPILVVALVAVPAVTLVWRAAKLAFSHVVLILAVILVAVPVAALVAILVAVLAAALVPIPAVAVARRLGKLSTKPVQAGGLLVAVLVPTHAKAHVVVPVAVRAAEPVLCTVVLPILIPATTPA